VITVSEVVESIRSVIDPDLGHSIVDMGLLREVILAKDRKGVKVNMTLTSPACPMAPELLAAVKQRALAVQGIEEAEVALVWSPPWDPRLDASEEVLDDLGIYDI